MILVSLPGQNSIHEHVFGGLECFISNKTDPMRKLPHFYAFMKQPLKVGWRDLKHWVWMDSENPLEVEPSENYQQIKK
jgi:hypothetical protein